MATQSHWIRVLTEEKTEQSTVTQSRSAGRCPGSGGTGRQRTAAFQHQEETSVGSGYAPHPDCGNGFTGVFIHQIPSHCTL